jgi:hypothetical protein
LKPKPPRGSKWRHDQRNALSHNRAAVHLEIAPDLAVGDGALGF